VAEMMPKSQSDQVKFIKVKEIKAASVAEVAL